VLSTQEGRIARLVAQGMTNQEVARELYLSTKTVEFHLSNVFTKLGITSRRQLRQRILSAEPTLPRASRRAAAASAAARHSGAPDAMCFMRKFALCNEPAVVAGR